ncbi:MAG TPA: hypothetical protein VM733_17910 [Thermoanaerobaculia bacterium]|nr:hypothetical protein [Thermoanaerobaculia bacterium]
MFRTLTIFVLALFPLAASAAQQGANLGVPQPLFPPSNWWNTDVSAAPVDPGSASYINFIGATDALHPDFGGDAGGGDVYGFPVITVEGNAPKKTVSFVSWPEQSDGVGVPFYPVPDEAMTQTGWVEGGQPGNVDQRNDADRHILIVDKTNNRLYELYNVWWNGTQWEAGSGAHFYMNRNDRRPDTWTSADAAGLAILPGLVRWEEVYGAAEIRHAFRFTVHATNGYVYPASHRAGSTSGAPPMGARLRLKAGKDISTFPADIQKILRAMKRYGLILADNGTDMYVSGTYDTRWNNDVLNPQLAKLKAGDFEVVQLGWSPGVAFVAEVPETMTAGDALSLRLTAFDRDGNVVTGYRGTVAFTSTDGAATLPTSYTFTAADAGTHLFPAGLILRTPGAQVVTITDTAAPASTGSRGTLVTATAQHVDTSTYWACFHYATRAAADARMNARNLDATLVAVPFTDYPWVVIERWTCGGCVQEPAPLFTATPRPRGYTPAADERIAMGTDGTELVVRRPSGASVITERPPDEEITVDP